MTRTIEERDRGAIRTIVLDRPDSMNSFDEEMGGDFLATLESAAEEAVRAVVITGRGKAFCAGEDLRALGSSYGEEKAPDLGDILRRRYNPAILAIRELRKPVVAAINGVAAGAGVSIALACDFRVMSEAASLVLAFSKVGLVPDSGGTWLLPRYVGVGRALRLAMEGDPLPASVALDLGLVDRLAPPADVLDVAEKEASRFGEGPTVGFGLIKRLIWKAHEQRLEDHLEDEAKAQEIAGRTDDHLEGVNAFLEKRPPRFTGS
jgi:2-(1,2-epoxy-1,2-dihydrophenyl)acetyl-CoA isomerase